MRDMDELTALRYPAWFRIMVFLFGAFWLYPLVRFFGTGPAPLVFASLYFGIFVFFMFAFWYFSRKFRITDDEIIARYPFFKARAYPLAELRGWHIVEGDEVRSVMLLFSEKKLEIPLFGGKLKEALATLTADGYPRLVASVEKRIESADLQVVKRTLFGEKRYDFRKDGFSYSFRGKTMSFAWGDFRSSVCRSFDDKVTHFQEIVLVTQEKKKIFLNVRTLGGQGGIAEYVRKKLGPDR